MPYVISHNDGGNPVNIYYEDWGKGDPVILIHGWPVSHEMWEYQASNLVGAGYRCITYDRRGFGKSDKPWGDYDYSTLAGDLKAIIDELKLQNTTLVGFSMAGGEVVRYCSLYRSAGVSKVVLVSSIAPYMLKTDTNQDGVPVEMFDEMITQLQDDRPAFLANFGKTFFGQSLLSHAVSEEILDWMQGLALCGSPRATIECLKSFSQTDFRNEMASVNVPTLIIHGDGDKTVPIKPTGEQAAKMIPNAIFKKYDGAPHGLFVTDKEELSADLVSFIRTGEIDYNYGGSADEAALPQGYTTTWP